jgi:hypothetical protein
MFLFRYTLNGGGSDEANYTSFNNIENGSSLLYDTLSKMDYNVSRGFAKLDEETGVQSAYIFIMPNNMDEHFFSAMDWVYGGGRLIYLDSGYYLMDSYLDYDYPIWQDDNFSLYEYGLGQVLTGDSELILNGALIKDNKPGEQIAATLDEWREKDLIFSEYIHGYGASNGAWAKIPTELRYLVFQIFLAMTMLVWFLGKRLGVPLPYFEELEREENEHVKALANIYHKAGAKEIVFADYLADFLVYSARWFHVSEEYARKNIKRLWIEAKLPNIKLIHKLENFLEALDNHVDFNSKDFNIKDFNNKDSNNKDFSRKNFGRMLKVLRLLQKTLARKGDFNGIYGINR